MFCSACSRIGVTFSPPGAPLLAAVSCARAGTQARMPKPAAVKMAVCMMVIIQIPSMAFNEDVIIGACRPGRDANCAQNQESTAVDVGPSGDGFVECVHEEHCP